jgi:hypothetical protein
MKKLSLIALLLFLTTTQDLLPMNFDWGDKEVDRHEYALAIREEIKQKNLAIEILERDALYSIDQYKHFYSNRYPIQSSSHLHIIQNATEKLETAKEKILQSIKTKENAINSVLIPIYQARAVLLNQEDKESIEQLIKNNLETMQAKINADKKLLEPLNKIVGFAFKKSEPKMASSSNRRIAVLIMITSYIAIFGLIGWYIYKGYNGSGNLLWRSA